MGRKRNLILPERDPLDVQHERLIAEQCVLLREHRDLEGRAHDAEAHREPSRRLRAHIEALTAHLAALRER